MGTAVTHEAPPRPAATGSRRWLSLDVFRGIAVLWMIQGHTFTALTSPANYSGVWGKLYELLHGLTAPMFLLGGGLAYGLVALRGQRSAVPDPRLLRRGLWLIALGYLLHLPRAPWSEILARRDLLAYATVVGPLQLVGACLWLCELLRALTRTRRRMVGAVVAVALGVTACAPLVWKVRASTHGPLLLGSWLDGYSGSQFPFFPWAVFFLVGVLLSVPALHVLRPEGATRLREVALGLALLACGASAAGFAYGMFVTGHVLRGLYGAHELWHTSPLYVLFRAGLVAAALGVLALAEPALSRLFRRAQVADRLFGALSRQSLVAYVTHLLVLYGTPFTTGLVAFGKLGLLQAAIALVPVLAFTTAIAVLWSHYVAPGTLRAALVASLRGRLGAGRPQVHGVGEGQRGDVRAAEQRLQAGPAVRHRV